MEYRTADQPRAPRSDDKAPDNPGRGYDKDRPEPSNPGRGKHIRHDPEENNTDGSENIEEPPKS